MRVCGNGTLGEKMSISKQINSVRRKGYSLMNDEAFHTINIKIRKTMSLYQSVGLIVLRIRIILSCSTIDSSNYSVWAGTFSTAD